MTDSSINAIVAAIQANIQNAQVRDAILAAIASSQDASTAAPAQSTSQAAGIQATCQTCVCPHGLSVASPAGVAAQGTAFYAVFVGRATGVFSSLPLVQALTTKVSGNTYYKFNSRDEAQGAYDEADRMGLVRIAN